MNNVRFLDYLLKFWIFLQNLTMFKPIGWETDFNYNLLYCFIQLLKKC